MSTTTDRRQGVYAGAAFKVPCRCATTGNITLATLQTIDGVVTTEGMRVLVWQQTSAIQNGIYSASSGTWVRTLDFDGVFDVKCGTLLWVTAGTTYTNSLFRVTSLDETATQGPIPDTDIINFALVALGLTADAIFTLIQNFFTSSDNSINISVNDTTNVVNITNNGTVPVEIRGAYMSATINPNSQIQPSGSFLTAIGGTASQVVETPPTSWSSKLMRLLLSSSAASTPCGYRCTTNANSGPSLSTGAGVAGGFTFGVLFGTHPTSELTATTSKFIGLSSFTSFSQDPTGGNWTNNANFNTGDAFGMVSNEGDSGWNFFHKAAGLSSTIISLGISRLPNQYFSFLASNAVGSGSTRIQIISFNQASGVQTTVFDSTLVLATPAGIYLQPFLCASAIAAVLHGIIFQRAFLYVPDTAFAIAS